MRVWLPFLAVEKNWLIHKRMWRDTGHDCLLAESNTAERRGLEKSTPDCWLFVSTILRQCALYDHYMIISRQFTLLHNIHLETLVHSPCFCCSHVFRRFLQFSFSLFQLISTPANTENLCINKEAMYMRAEMESVHLFCRNIFELLGYRPAAVAELLYLLRV